MRILCKHCGKPLYHEDTLDHEGGIEDGFLQEHQLWSCEHCQIDYVIDQWAKLSAPEITYFEEA